MIAEKYYITKTKKFLKLMNDFCEENDIEKVFSKFLFYNKNDICSPSYYFLHLCPKLYLANSKSFKKYYNSLDIDFQQDIISKKDMKDAKIFLKNHSRLLNFYRKIQLKDSIL